MKLKSHSFILIPILISILDSQGFENINNENLSNYITNTPSEVSKFIENNFSSFVNEYNLNSENKWNATSIENKFEIIIDTIYENYNGIFLDFNDDNGYAVVGNNYTFLDFQCEGESPYLNIESTSYYYSTLSGYLYLKDGEYYNVIETKNTPEEFLYEDDYNRSTTGQLENSTGCGHIVDPDLYIKETYCCNDFVLESEKSLPMRTDILTNQSALSCYFQYEINNGNVKEFSEGNCSTVATYNVLQSIADATGEYANTRESFRKKIDSNKINHPVVLPRKGVNINIKQKNMPKSDEIVEYLPKRDEPNIYANYYDSNGNNLSKLLDTKDDVDIYEFKERQGLEFPKLYTDIRKVVNDRYKNIQGGSSFERNEILTAVTSKYDYNFNVSSVAVKGDDLALGIKSINGNLPFVYSVREYVDNKRKIKSNGGYKNHAMACCGYRIYKVNMFTISIYCVSFTVTEYKYLYELRDGHNYDVKTKNSTGKIYFDISAYTGSSSLNLLNYSEQKYGKSEYTLYY